MSTTNRQPVPIRITITLPFTVFCWLRDRADREGRSTSNLGAFLLERALTADTEKPAHGRLLHR